ncbi:hypothetical protein SAMN02745944_01398 [Clostridium magnum DSM 2767]|nr:hypothetical protein SAMN02745944_01398 [Clostridium magnum DSM 2767]
MTDRVILFFIKPSSNWLLDYTSNCRDAGVSCRADGADRRIR